MFQPSIKCTHINTRISLRRLSEGMSEAEKRKQVQVDVKSLQILRAIIYNQIVQIDPELKEREPAEYRK